jgi:hypothetical protein
MLCTSSGMPQAAKTKMRVVLRGYGSAARGRANGTGLLVHNRTIWRPWEPPSSDYPPLLLAICASAGISVSSLVTFGDRRWIIPISKFSA